MIREVNLISYLPKFIQEYREIKDIMVSENPEIQKLEDETEVIKNNQFILSCDLNGIKRFEELLKITPNIDDTLEARILRVLIRWNDSIPYTYRGLINKLNTLCGEDNYILFPNFNDYELELVVKLIISGQVEELDYILSYMIPANISVNSNNIIYHKVEGKLFLGGITVENNYFKIKSSTDKERTVNGNITNGAIVSTIIKRTIN